MTKCLTLLLFIGLAWGQDTLILKKGAQYEGEFLGLKSKKVHFKPSNTSNFKPKRIKEIKKLIRDGELIIKNGKLLVEKEDVQFVEKPMATSKPITYSKVIQCPSTSKTKLYISLNDWFATNYNSANEVIQMSDKDEGIIIGKGVMDYRHKKFTYICSGGWVKYTIKVYVKDNRYKVDLTNFTHSVLPKNGAHCALGLITDATEHTTKGFSKTFNNDVWKDIKVKISDYSDLLFISLNEHTDRQSTNESQDDW
tara:strand:+ start:1119 stop:1877 length:759 start_codon:yes stop_codon:yes gene_type:complete